MNVAEEARLVIFEAAGQPVQVRLEGASVWLTQAQMAEVFDTTLANVSLHLQNIYTEQELAEEATIKDYLIVRSEGDRQVNRRLKHYNLDAIISVGYRVNSDTVSSSASGPRASCAITSPKATPSTLSGSPRRGWRPCRKLWPLMVQTRACPSALYS